MIDLHLHSTASDGLFTPSQLVEQAAEKGASLIALTDHDSLAGTDEFLRTGAEKGVAAVPGIEISAQFNPGELHLLGYGVESGGEALRLLCEEIRRGREERNREIFSQMQTDGLEVDYQAWRDELTTPAPGRPHIADYLIQKGEVKSRREAFAKYLSEGRPYYRPRYNPSLERSIAAIHEAAGLAVVAHPLSLRISHGRLLDLLPLWREMGIDGIEVIHPTVNRHWYRRLSQAAAEQGLLASGGSDFHGAPGEQRFFGKTSWGDPIPEELSLVPELQRFQI